MRGVEQVLGRQRVTLAVVGLDLVCEGHQLAHSLRGLRSW